MTPWIIGITCGPLPQYWFVQVPWKSIKINLMVLHVCIHSRVIWSVSPTEIHQKYVVTKLGTKLKFQVNAYLYMVGLYDPLLYSYWGHITHPACVYPFKGHDAPSYLSSKFVYTSSVHSQNTRSQSSNTLLMPSFNIKHGKRTFNFRGSSIWNSLPTDVRCNLFSMSIQTFKAHVIL